jgi:hypothetical protein
MTILRSDAIRAAASFAGSGSPATPPGDDLPPLGRDFVPAFAAAGTFTLAGDFALVGVFALVVVFFAIAAPAAPSPAVSSASFALTGPDFLLIGTKLSVFLSSNSPRG